MAALVLAGSTREEATKEGNGRIVAVPDDNPQENSLDLGYQTRLHYGPALLPTAFPPLGTYLMIAGCTRRSHIRSVWRGGFVIGVSLLFFGGCMAKPGPREDETTMDFRWIARVYESIQSFNQRPPRDLDEIKKYLADYQTDRLIEDAEKVLTGRDGLPYVIVLGAQFGGPEDEIIFYEKKGVDGQRYVMTTRRLVRKLTDDEFRQARFVKQHRPEAT